jgi:hypothetical protein
MFRLVHALPFVLLLAATPLHAHQDHLVPQHGGVTAEAGYFQVEAVTQGARVVLHLSEHGAPLAVAGATGKLTLLSAGKKMEATLAPSGPHALAATFATAPAAGAKAVAALSVPGKGTASVRFVLK